MTNANTQCALCGTQEIEILGICSACAADNDAVGRLVQIAADNGNEVHGELREFAEWQLTYAVSEFFGVFDESQDGNWADSIGSCLDGTGFEAAQIQPDGSDPAELLNVAVGNETWCVCRIDDSLRSDNPCAYGILVRCAP